MKYVLVLFLVLCAACMKSEYIASEPVWIMVGKG